MKTLFIILFAALVFGCAFQWTTVKYKCRSGIGRKYFFLTILLVIFCSLILISCASSPKHIALSSSQLPELIPLRHFIANLDANYGYKISPDGKKLAWIAVKNTRLKIHYRRIDQKDVTILNKHTAVNINWFEWLPDSRRILYLQNQGGNENFHIYLVDSERPDQIPTDLTPFEDTRAYVHQVVRTDREKILIAHNKRDKTVFDLYWLNLKTKEQTLVDQNPGNVLYWITDNEGNLRARVANLADDKRILEVFNQTSRNWTGLATLGLEDSIRFLSFTADDNGMWLLSNRGRDRISLVRLDLKTGQEFLAYEDPQTDVEGVLISYHTKNPLIAFSNPEYQKLYFFDSRSQHDLSFFREPGPVVRNILSSDYQERILTVSTYTDKGGEYYLIDWDTGKKVLLGRHPMSRYADALSTKTPIAFKSRDGLMLHGYLTLPKGATGKGLPMVVLVHGGPWRRDYWGYDSNVQFLANRGYAVLQINYRGSTGYGRRFKEAAVGEFAGKMHTDLIDGVQWAVTQGIADEQKVAIYGGSYGGYAALVGLAFTPETFACGIDAFGVSNLVTFMEAVPKYWKNWMPLWYKYVGNPDIPADRRNMEAKSPLFRVDDIQRPLLIAQGANDPRVRQQESDQIVSAIRKAGKEVDYIIFPGEGHGFGRWQSRMVFYRKVEEFLAKHLGGRSAGFDAFQLGI
jgi:dipeptidyl aminopeptidase/acylaminoacyl peptidase